MATALQDGKLKLNCTRTSGFQRSLRRSLPGEGTGVRGCRLCEGTGPSKSPGPCSARRRNPRRGRPSRSLAPGASPSGSATVILHVCPQRCRQVDTSSGQLKSAEISPLSANRHGRGVKHLALVGGGQPPPEDLPGRVHQHLEAVVLLLLGGADGPSPRNRLSRLDRAYLHTGSGRRRSSPWRDGTGRPERSASTGWRSA